MNTRAVEMLSSIPMPLDERIERYARKFGLTVGNSAIETDDEMEQVLQEAMPLLPEADRLFLQKTPILTVHGRLGPMSVQGEGERRSDGKRQLFVNYVTAMTDERGIWIYPASMRKTGPDLDHDGYVDWMRRLLMHEIGHARDHRSDHAMAKESNY